MVGSCENLKTPVVIMFLVSGEELWLFREIIIGWQYHKCLRFSISIMNSFLIFQISCDYIYYFTPNRNGIVFCSSICKIFYLVYSQNSSILLYKHTHLYRNICVKIYLEVNNILRPICTERI